MKNLKKIEQFVHGELKDADLWEFKKKLENDPELAAELKRYRELEVIVNQTDKLNLMNTLNEIKKDDLRQQSQPKIKPLRMFAYAASVLILVSIGISLLFFMGSNNTEAVFEAYYQPESSAMALRSNVLHVDQAISKGLQLYELKEYSAALDYFSQVPENLLGRLYSGLSHVETAAYGLAAEDFLFIIKHNDNLFIDQAEWYLALVYLKTNQKDDAVRLFSKIANDRGFYRTKAQKILDEAYPRK